MTDTPTKGYYGVYLFASDGSRVHLSLNQGATEARKEFKSEASKVLRERASLMRARLHDFSGLLPRTTIDVVSDGTFPTDYEAGHVLGETYQVDDLPTEEVLITDLLTAIHSYRTLTFRGGTDTEVKAPEEGPLSLTIEEGRRQRMHSRVERNSSTGRKVKQLLGTTCQACGFDFPSRYGKLGSGFIEAHHLQPVSSFTEGGPVSLNIKDDFAVLCANCHRMIHKLPSGSSIETFRAEISK